MSRLRVFARCACRGVAWRAAGLGRWVGGAMQGGAPTSKSVAVGRSGSTRQQDDRKSAPPHAYTARAPLPLVLLRSRCHPLAAWSCTRTRLSARRWSSQRQRGSGGERETHDSTRHEAQHEQHAHERECNFIPSLPAVLLEECNCVASPPASLLVRPLPPPLLLHRCRHHSPLIVLLLLRDRHGLLRRLQETHGIVLLRSQAIRVR